MINIPICLSIITVLCLIINAILLKYTNKLYCIIIGLCVLCISALANIVHGVYVDENMLTSDMTSFICLIISFILYIISVLRYFSLKN